MNTSDVLNRITGHKISQRPLVQLLEVTDQKLFHLVNGCGTWLHLRQWATGEARLKHANFCGKFLLCRSCAARRAAKMVVAYHRKIEAITAAEPALIPAMVTLTVKNGPDLAERLQHLKTAWKRMMEDKRRGASESGRHRPVEWNKVRGSIRAIEVTKGDTGWHPHIHCFTLLSGYVDQKRLSAEWERYTGDSKIVGITKCRNGIVRGLIECLKYASKLTEMNPADILHTHYTAAGSRFTDPQGCLRGVPEPDIRVDSDEGLTGPYQDFIALWLGNGYRLIEGQSMTVLGRDGPQEVAGIRQKVIIERPNKPENN